MAAVTLAVGIWWGAGRRKINWNPNVNAMVTSYHKNCDYIVAGFLGGKAHAHLSPEEYRAMVAALQSCNRTTGTPVAER